MIGWFDLYDFVGTQGTVLADFEILSLHKTPAHLL